MKIINYYNKGRIVYLFVREDDGKLKILKDSSFYPYYYESDNKGEFTAIDGIKVKKVIVSDPKEINNFKSKNSYEADINYCKRYIIDKIKLFEKCPIKWGMLDIEVLKLEDEYPDPITAKFPVISISLYNSKFDKIKTWYIGDYFDKDPQLIIEDAEIELFKDFIDYLQKAKFDLLIGWYMNDFDYPYCYSSDTEVMTENGWMLLKDIVDQKLKIKIATLNPKTNKVEYHYPQDYIKYKYNGKMFYQGGKYINTLVTPNHNLWIKSNTHSNSNWHNYQFVKANQTKQCITFKKDFPINKKKIKWFILPKYKNSGWIKFRKNKKIKMDDWLKFLGLYLSEGHLYNNNNRTIVISQSKIANFQKCQEIEKLLTKIKIGWSYHGHKYCFSSVQLYTYLKQFGKAKDKFIPKELLKLNKEQSWILLKTLIKGDGHIKQKNQYSYCTISKQLAKDVQELALRSGFVVSLNKYKKFYTLYINKRYFNHSPNRKKDLRKYVNYNNFVYCLTISNNLLFVRRNYNDYHWSGNCYNRFSKLPQKEFFKDSSMYNNFATAISPIGQVRGGKKDYNNFYPAGTSIIDYLTWLKKIYKNEKSYALDTIAEKYLKQGKKYKEVDFSKIREEIKLRNIDDVELMVKLEKEKFKFIPLYDEIRRFSKVGWEDFAYNSRIIDMLLLQEAKERNIILPNGKSYENDSEEFEGAYRETFETGDFYNVGKYDLGCYSEDTEILTEDGWKKYYELNKNDIVASFNINNNKIEFQPILHLNIQKVKNIEMYHLKNQRTDQLLTWNHKVLFKQLTVSYRKQENNPHSWHVQFAKDIPLHHSLFPLSGEIEKRPDYFISDEILKIHAWIITEGHKNHNYYYISQSNKTNASYCKEIQIIFKKLKWNVSKYDRKGWRKGEFTWNLKWLYSTYIHLEDNYKVIPLWMLQQLSLRQLNLLFETLMKGDGNKKQWQYYAKDKLARDRFQYLCCLIGRASLNRKKGLSGVVFCCSEKYTTINKGKQKIKYTGTVWCPSVKNGFIVMRRKGGTFISGNSAYPTMLQDLCLDPSNIVDKPGENIITVNVTDRETRENIESYFIKQNSEALLPSAVKRILVEKAKFKKLVKETPKDNPIAKDIKITYEGVKNIINSYWGTLGNRFFRLYDHRIAGMITSSVRGLLHYIKDKCEVQGYKIIYCDTDSVFVMDNNKDLSEFINNLIQQWSKEQFNKEITITIDREGNFEKLLILAMCRYKGYLNTSKGIEPETKGIQAKRKDSTIFIAKFQDTLIDKILNKESQDQIIEWIKSEIERLKTLPLEEIAFPAKLSQKIEDYKTEVTNKKGTTYTKDPPIFVRALKNTTLLTGKTKRVGDNYYWIYVQSQDPKKNVLAFDEKNKDYIRKDTFDLDKNIDQKFIIDWNMMVQRNVYNIIEVIFEAMKWDVHSIIPLKIRKSRKKKESGND